MYILYIEDDAKITFYYNQNSDGYGEQQGMVVGVLLLGVKQLQGMVGGLLLDVKELQGMVSVATRLDGVQFMNWKWKLLSKKFD